MPMKQVQRITIEGVEYGPFENTYSPDDTVTKHETTWLVAPTDKEIDVPVDVSTVQWALLIATANCTLETNAVDAAGGQTITLYANDPFVWKKPGATPYFANPFTPDITKFYLTSVATTGNLKMFFGVDATP